MDARSATATGEIALRLRLWEQLTGPKTEGGKRIVAQNANKHGQRSRALSSASSSLTLH
ncbi:hypothetical protein H6F49_08695 [Nodosilinea sp. FACHB-13]|nr:hypothetical protein [Nodosilinea sp. FACHB-13]